MSPTNQQADAGLNDPNVKIPGSVKRAAALADAVHKQAYGGEAPPPDAPPETPPPAADAPPAPVSTATEPEPQRTDNKDPGSWENRFFSMKGRFDRAEALNKQLSTTINARDEQIVGLQATLAAMGSAKPAPATDAEGSFLTPEQREAYGEEMLGVVGSRAREVFEPKIAAMQAEVADLRKQLAETKGTSIASAREIMLQTLDKEIPIWTKVNSDAGFNAWLALPDAFSGAKRLDLLRTAFEQNQTPRVLAFFKSFLAEEAALAPAGSEIAPPAAAPAAGGKVDLTDLAAPSRTKAAAPQTPAEKPIFTGADISKFYEDVRKGVYVGREAEKNTLERQIFEASTEGRVR